MSFDPARNSSMFAPDPTRRDNHRNHQYANGEASSSNAASSYSYSYSQNLSSGKGHAKKKSMSTEEITEKIGDFFGTNLHKDLPLYKDKPHFPMHKNGIINRLFPRGRRKRWLVLGAALFTFWWFASSLAAWLSVTSIDWNTRRDFVRHAFTVSWEDYAAHAWGKDDYSPISRNSKFIVSKHGEKEPVNAGAGWIIVDALDTAILMNCTRQVAQARKWIETSLDFSKLDGEINTFETTIRVLGGLLSAHYLSTTFPHLAAQRDDDIGQKGEDLYIEKAVDLADRLLGAFETPSGIPYASVNLNTSRGIPSHDMSGVSSTAEAGTLQLEMKYVAKLTGEPLYWTMAERVIQAIDAPRKEGGLVPIFIDPETGEYMGYNIRLGSRGDSYYEYLIKQYLQTGEQIYKEMWDEALEGIKRYMITWSEHASLTVLAERPEGLKGSWSGKMDHLTCFLPGTIALATTGGLTVEEAKRQMGNQWGRKQEQDMILAEELMKTCWGMYVITPTGLAPEIAFLKIENEPSRWNFTDPDWTPPRSLVDFEDIHSSDYKNLKAPWRKDYEIQHLDTHNLQRPESVESLFYLWRITGKPMYREWAWRMFRSFSDYTKVVDRFGRITGYTSIENVMKVPPAHLDTVIAGHNMAQSISNAKPFLSRDNLEGFWLSETLKYFYLIFSENVSDDWYDLTKIVLNTEAHLFPRFDTSGQGPFKTGWSRKERQPTPVEGASKDRIVKGDGRKTRESKEPVFGDTS